MKNMLCLPATYAVKRSDFSHLAKLLISYKKSSSISVQYYVIPINYVLRCICLLCILNLSNDPPNMLKYIVHSVHCQV